jgi:type I restriction enzyme S subunit
VLFSNFVKRLDPLRGVDHAVVGWYHLKSAYQSGAIANHRIGSAFPNLDLDGLLTSFKFPRPACQTAEAFAAFVEPFSSPQLIAESCKLATLRDYLLPRLLSGKVRVSVSQPAIGIREVAPAPSGLELKPLPRHATDEFKEAILIAALVRALAKPSYPLGRKRYNKIAYFVHRKAEHDVRQHYLKKAAGPYSPWAKYQGPERIAASSGYIERCKAGQYAGLIAGKKIAAIDTYLPRYGFAPAIEWAVTQFRYRKNDDLELLATVDFASIDLRDRSERIDVGTVQELIANEPEWAPKLERAIFSDLNVARALRELSQLFPTD